MNFLKYFLGATIASNAAPSNDVSTSSEDDVFSINAPQSSSSTDKLQSLIIETNTKTNVESVALESSEYRKGSKNCRKNKKFLTTCKQCGHYRFVRKNSKRVINLNFPYEHSIKGGCHVERKDFIQSGKRFRRICFCQPCTEAAALFDHNPTCIVKKKNQYIYNRTPEQEVIWRKMKAEGWRCRAGSYFKPGHLLDLNNSIDNETFSREFLRVHNT